MSLASERTKYQLALEKLPKLAEELKKVFLLQSNDQKFIENDQISAVLKDWGEILGINVSKAKYWFREGNSKIPKEIELNKTTFEDFLGIFKMWLVHENEQIEKSLKNAADPVISPATKKKIPESGKGGDVEPLPSKDYEYKKMILDVFLEENEVEVARIFSSSVFVSKGKIPLKEWLPFMKEVSTQLGFLISYSGSETSLENFYQLPTVKTKLPEIVNSFLLASQRKDNKMKFSLKECFQLLDHWAQIDEQIYFVYESKQKAITRQALDLRQSLTDSVMYFSTLLAQASNEYERQVLIETIKALSVQLGKVENYDYLIKMSEDPEDYYAEELISKTEKETEETDEELENQYRQSLEEIYQHYCKLQDPRKDNIIMPFGVFVMVISDFDLLSTDQDSQKIVELFERYSHSGDSLDFQSFMKAIEKVADILYVMEDDLETHRERVTQLYQYLGLHDGRYREKLSTLNKYNEFSRENSPDSKNVSNFESKGLDMIRKPKYQYGGGFRRVAVKGSRTVTANN